MKRRYDRINKISKNLAEEAFRAYSSKRDYKRALEIYCMLSEYKCIPKNISNFSKNMIARLGKKIEDTR